MKQTALLLALLLAANTLLSCGSETAEETEIPYDPADAEQTEPVAETEPKTEETRAQHSLDLEALDFGGEEVHSYVLDWQGHKYYFFADEATGNNMNDAVYSRRLKVEEELNIMLAHTKNPDLGQYCASMKQNIIAGDDLYDLMFNHCIQDIATFACEGYLYTLDLLPHIDMDADWWNKKQMDILRLGKNTYYAVNDMMVPCPAVIMFNKDMITENSLANPYELVYEGNWTLDSMAEIARAVTRDFNGDGVMNLDDQYGLAGTGWGSSCYINFMTGAGQFITSRGSDGRIQLDFYTEKTQSIMELFAALATENVIFAPVSQENKPEQQMWMASDRLMFQIVFLDKIEEYRDIEVDFGLLPYPKYDSAQEDYINLDWGGLLSVPNTITNPDAVGAAMELLAWESANEVLPAYYDVVLAGKLARDEDSAKMLDIIFDTIAYEIGGNYFGFAPGFNDLFYSLPRLPINQKSSDFSSLYAKHEKTAANEIEKFYTKLEKTEDTNS